MLLNFISLISSGTELFQNLGRNWSTDQKNWIAFTKLWREASNICSSFNYFWDTFGIRLLHLLEIFRCYLSTDPKTFVCSSLCCNRINVHLNCVFVFVSSKSHHFHMTESSFWENWSLCIINIVQMLTVQFFHLLNFFLVFVLMFFDMWNSFLFFVRGSFVWIGTSKRREGLHFVNFSQTSFCSLSYFVLLFCWTVGRIFEED
jgi:hypothetical protein